MTTELEEAKARLTVLVDARLHPPHPTMNPIREDSTITVRLADLRTLLSAVDGDGFDPDCFDRDELTLAAQAVRRKTEGAIEEQRADRSFVTLNTDYVLLLLEPVEAMIAAAPPVPEGGE